MEVPNKIPYYRKGNERGAETCFLKMKLNQKSTVRQLLAPKRLTLLISWSRGVPSHVQ